jgi:hypothetical protein
VVALVPPYIQHLLELRAGALAYAPTRGPFGYRYQSYTWNAAAKQLTVRLHDRHYKLSNANRGLAVTVRWSGGPFERCRDGNEKSYQVDGNLVFSSGGDIAWRCVRGQNGRSVKIVATGKNLPAAALAIVASSVKRL